MAAILPPDQNPPVNVSTDQFLSSGGFLRRNFLGDTHEESLLKLINQTKQWCAWNNFQNYFDRQDFVIVGKNDPLPYSSQKLTVMQSTLFPNDRLAVLKSGYYFEKTTEPFVISIRTWHGEYYEEEVVIDDGFVYDEDYSIGFTENYKAIPVKNIPPGKFAVSIWRTSANTVIEYPQAQITWIGKKDLEMRRPSEDLERLGTIVRRQGSVQLVQSGFADIDPIELFVYPNELFNDTFLFGTWPVIDITFGETWKFPINKRLGLLVRNVPTGGVIELLTTDFTTGITPIFASKYDHDSSYSSPQLELNKVVSNDSSKIIYTAYIP